MHIKTTDEDLRLLKEINITGDWKKLTSFKQRFLFQKMLYFKMLEHPERKNKYLSILKEIADLANKKLSGESDKIQKKINKTNDIIQAKEVELI